MKLSIIMPVFNEVETVAAVVARVQSVPIEQEIVLVNDASSDGTREVVDSMASPCVQVVHHAMNRGKGAGIRTGLEAASGDLVVIQDADLEYDPFDLLRLIEPILGGRAQVVYGARDLGSQRTIMRWGNRFVTGVANVLYGQYLRDIETCYKLMRRDIALRLDLRCRRFDVEAEITAKLLRMGYKIHEMPISYSARYENKKLSPLDGLPTLRALWRYRGWQPTSTRSAPI
jgi:glycosyltransferase involved in cell wall biosynthesis